jgi:hypothetical protein
MTTIDPDLTMTYLAALAATMGLSSDRGVDDEGAKLFVICPRGVRSPPDGRFGAASLPKLVRAL